MIVYDKLFRILRERKIHKIDLCEMADISPATMHKMVTDKRILTDAIEKICDCLDVQPGDIMENIKSNKKGTQTTEQMT